MRLARLQKKTNVNCKNDSAAFIDYCNLHGSYAFLHICICVNKKRWVSQSRPSVRLSAHSSQPSREAVPYDPGTPQFQFYPKILPPVYEYHCLHCSRLTSSILASAYFSYSLFTDENVLLLISRGSITDRKPCKLSITGVLQVTKAKAF